MSNGVEIVAYEQNGTTGFGLRMKNNSGENVSFVFSSGGSIWINGKQVVTG